MSCVIRTLFPVLSTTALQLMQQLTQVKSA